ncbi:hypothetical protein AB0B28_15975 [Glycomyces sp. NPDC046736]|uniref:hypothetical protein n=1 Tax=Glycomyces sp. NPDC046736 TaxID=3155615 RepID=UPI0033CD92BA
MSSASEAAGAIDGLRQHASELAGKVNSSKGQAEAMAGALEGIGAEDKSRQVSEVANKLEAAEASRAGFEGTLAKAHFVMLSVMHGNMGPAVPGSGVIVPHTSVDADGAPTVGLDAIPPQLRQDAKPSGEELMGIDPKLGFLDKEHENANTDQGMSKFRRGARNVARNAQDYSDAVKELTKPATTEMTEAFQPPETYPVVGTAEPAATFTALPQTHFDGQNAVGNLVVVAVLVTEVIARRMKDWRAKT